MSKPRLTRYYQSHEIEGRGGRLYRFIEERVEMNEERVTVSAITQTWRVWDPDNGNSMLAGDFWPDGITDIDEICRIADQAALQWYEIPQDDSSVAGRRVASISQHSLMTHCQRCNLELVFDGSNGMVCPVHGWDYK